MQNFKKQKVLVIPDIHQNLWFADKCLEIGEKENVDKIIFLGDFFDCLEGIDNKKYFSVKNVCRWIDKIYKDLYSKAVFLVGNHDVSYISSYNPASFRIDKMSKFYVCSGWTKSKAITFNENIDPNFLNSLELCCYANGFLISHAGFHYNHFKPLISEEENIERYYNSWEKEKMSFKNDAYHWIGHVGHCRGGEYNVGSPVWLDFEKEFEGIDCPQIVGHTNNIFGTVKHNNGLCIDVFRTLCVVIEEGGKIVEHKVDNCCF